MEYRLTDEEQDDCTPTKKQVADYLGGENKGTVLDKFKAASILYGRNIQETLLQKLCKGDVFVSIPIDCPNCTEQWGGGCSLCDGTGKLVSESSLYPLSEVLKEEK